MPTSYSFFKEEIKKWFLTNVSLDKRVLDVGPGIGTYSDLLREAGYKMDAVEIYNPYVDKYKLREKYDNVYVDDIMRFDYSDYDFIILGDILEHLAYQEATVLIKNIKSKNKQCLVAVPYMMPQGEHEGNIHETHHQDDLSPENMKTRYPLLNPLYTNVYYGYYTLPQKKAYVLYATESYASTVQGCVNSLKAVSKIPIYVYMLNSGVQIAGAISINWKCDALNPTQEAYIDRASLDIYKVLIQRPLIVKDALENYADVIAYVDADSVATEYVDNIFDYFPENNSFPYFVEGIYEFLKIGDRGGAFSRDNMEDTLEAPACKLFNVNQYVRQKYRQTGYFVADKNCIEFLDEWFYMCIHPKILKDSALYAPYNEETILNVLLWKYNIEIGLPYLYTNGSIEEINLYNLNKLDSPNRDWFKVPEKKNELLFYHGEKNLIKINKMIKQLRNIKRIMFIPSHLSTGGMPQFLLKRIEVLKKYSDYEIFVVEYQCHSLDFVVQRDAIKKIVGDNFITLYENKMHLFDVIESWNPDIIHIDEMSERLDRNMITQLYSSNRSYKIVETCHDVSFVPEEKIFIPDSYIFCTPYHLDTFKDNKGKKYVIEYPIENNKPSISQKKMFRALLGMKEGVKQVLNVGLWTAGKNQAEGLRIARKYPRIQFHFVGNQAGNFKDYWEPLMKNVPKNVIIWGERNDIDVFMKACDVFMFNSTWECNPLVLKEAISHHLPIIARNLPQYKDIYTPYIQCLTTNLDDIEIEYKTPLNNTIKEFAENNINAYAEITESDIQVSSNEIYQHFVDKPFLEIKGQKNSEYLVKFFDGDLMVYANTIKNNCWVQLNKHYYIKWKAQVWEEGVLIYENILDYTDKRVGIVFESSALGDSLAWMPYVLEFQKKHNCHVIVSTYKNFLFKKMYPELEFVEPGTTINNLYGLYRIGCFYDENKEPVFPNSIPLQKVACNILGLEYEEIIPKIDFFPKKRLYDFKYVTIATNSTSGCKYWQKEDWQKTVDFLVEQGYKVINVSKEKNPLNNVEQIKDVSLENTMHVIHHSEFMIGLSSGLSWMAWALKKKVVMISNFTSDTYEFQTDCIRMVNKDVCHNCWSSNKLDAADWNWCPINKNTENQFICQRSITSEMVINEIKKLL
jgi:autotransporter strand-loop-strand O-heptosyltransferase